VLQFDLAHWLHSCIVGGVGDSLRLDFARVEVRADPGCG
jgi:hypothetical protein